MKKLTFLLIFAVLCTVLLSACDRSPVKVQKDIQVDGVTVSYMVAPFWQMYNELGHGNYVVAAIRNQETAIAHAEAIFQGIKNGRLAEKYVPTELFFDEEQEVWITAFTKKGRDPQKTEGDCYRIAVRKSDGTVLRIWHEK